MSEVGRGSPEIRMSEVGGRGARGWEIDDGSLEDKCTTNIVYRRIIDAEFRPNAKIRIKPDERKH